MMPRPGTVALVGSGEFLAPMVPVDRALLDRLGEPSRVAIVPTAAAPDGDAAFERWLRLGVEYFTALDADASPIALRTRADAEDLAVAARLAAHNFIYLSGGKPGYLRQTLAGTPCWQAIVDVHAAGGIIAGCSAGAMVLGGALADFPRFWRPAPGLGLVPGIAIIPHFDELPMSLLANLMDHFAGDATVVGIDGTTALVGTGGAWTVLGRGGVTVVAGRESARFTAGQSVPLPVG